MTEEPKITVIKPKGGFRLPEFKGLKMSPVVLVVITIVLAVASVITALTLYQRRAEPIAPTAPKPAAAVGESCTLAFIVLGPTPSPSPTPPGTPGPTPTPTPTPTTSPTPTPTPSTTPGPTPTPIPTPTPVTFGPAPTPTPVIVSGPTPTPVTLAEAGSVAGTWTVALAGIGLLLLGGMLLLAF